jgi:hypothetical protein
LKKKIDVKCSKQHVYAIKIGSKRVSDLGTFCFEHFTEAVRKRRYTLIVKRFDLHIHMPVRTSKNWARGED